MSNAWVRAFSRINASDQPQSTPRTQRRAIPGLPLWALCALWLIFLVEQRERALVDFDFRGGAQLGEEGALGVGALFAGGLELGQRLHFVEAVRPSRPPADQPEDVKSVGRLHHP